MAGLSSTLEIARNTLLNEQVQIQVASYNIANADNTAYARQKANLTTNPATRIQAGWIGTGARIDTITQVRDQYVEQQLLASTAQESDYSTRASMLETLGTYVNDTGDTGISAELGDFWDAWDALSQDPTGTVARQGVISAAQSLVDTFNSTQTNLTSLKENLQSQTGDTVEKINTLLDQIADYNYSIVRLESGGDSANDMRDLRYEALTELSQELGINYTEEDNGAITVTLQDGSDTITLISDHKSGELAYDEGTGLVSYTDTEGGTTAPDPNTLSGGTLAGLLASLQETTAVNDQLDTMVSELVDQVNALHNATSLGVNVFSGSTMADITVDSDFTDPDNVNGDQASAIAELQNTKIANLDESTFVDYLSGIQQQIGLDEEEASSQAEYQQALVDYFQTKQQSVSGVSIDEEMVDLIKFQQIYQAAAKIVSTTQELLSTVIEMVD